MEEMTSGHFWVTGEQTDDFLSFFPNPCAKLRADDRRVLSGIIYVQNCGPR